MRGRGLLVASCLGSAACAVPQQMLAAPSDLADYRAYRLATGEGARLSRAQAYLRRHPSGAWADEVRTSFEAEEGAWFEAAKTSRTRARDYVVDLPHGPHAAAAQALLQDSDAQEQDLDTLELLADARRTSANLDVEAAQRRQVNDLLLEEVAALVDPESRGADLRDPPPSLGRVLGGGTRSTWGKPAAIDSRDDDLYFLLRTPAQNQARVAQVRFHVTADKGRLLGGTIYGEDLFIRWTEANEMRVLDASEPDDRAAAAASVGDLLAGAFEARLPAAKCAAKPAAGELLLRACDGWRVSAKMGKRPGEADVVRVDFRAANRK